MADDEKKSEFANSFDDENARALAEMLSDPVTSENVRLQIINEILEKERDETFFETIFREMLSYAPCPFCDHKSHWMVPEDDLNQFGWVTSQEDDRVPRNPTIRDCVEFQECCQKKRVHT
jgi:hypothetical protein